MRPHGLTKEQISDIRARFGKEPTKDIAQAYGVTRAAVLYHVNKSGQRQRAERGPRRPSWRNLTQARVDAMLARYQENECTIAEVGREFGVAEATVRYHVEQAKLPKRPRRSFFRIDMKPLVKAYGEGASLNELAAISGHTPETIRKRFDALGIPPRSLSEYGRVFSDAQVREFGELYMTGATGVEIAQAYGTDKSIVYTALHRAGIPVRSMAETRLLRGTFSGGRRRSPNRIDVAHLLKGDLTL